MVRSLVAGLALAALLLSPVGGGAPPTVSAQERALPGVPAGPEVGIDLDLLRQIQEQTAAIRGLAPGTEVPVRVVSRQDYGRFVRERIEGDEAETALLNEAVRASSTWRLLVLLGLVMQEVNPIEVSTEVAVERVAGFYVPTLNAMVLITDRANAFGPQEQITYAHEYVHALQDHHYDLDILGGAAAGNSDARQAVRALVEGDAELASYLWAGQAIGAEALREYAAQERREREEAQAAQAEQGAAPGSARARPEIPRFIATQRAFTYRDGLRFASIGYAQTNDYSGVDQLFAEPPQSTEHVLHPEKYWAREQPVPVSLPDLPAVLGNGWTQLQTDVLGELDILQVLQEHTNTRAAVQAAAGWGGGQWVLLEYAGQAAAVLRLTWDTELDAREFYDVYAHGLQARFPDAQVEAATSQRQALTATNLSTELRIHGQDILAVIAFNRASAEALAAGSGF